MSSCLLLRSLAPGALETGDRGHGRGTWGMRRKKKVRKKDGCLVLQSDVSFNFTATGEEVCVNS